MRKELEAGEVIQGIYHAPCVFCPSSDGMTGYKHKDGRLQLNCFVCGTNFNTYSENDFKARLGSLEGNLKIKGDRMTEETNKGRQLDKFSEGKVRADRGVSPKVMEFFGVKTNTYQGDANRIARHLYPYFDKQGTMISQKVRNVLTPTGEPTKSFYVEYLKDKNDWKNAMLFGQSLFPAGSAKFLTVVEGEVDAMSAFQMMGEKYPVVSFKNGFQSVRSSLENKDIYSYFDSFDKIVLSPDTDEQGQKAKEVFAEIFPGKTLIMPMAYKDANEYLKANKGAEFVSHWWKAKPFQPQGLILSSDIAVEVMENTIAKNAVPFPFEGVDDMLFGIRERELTTVAAGTGVGKSATVREVAEYLRRSTPHRIGMIMLEESNQKSGMGLVGIAMNKNLMLWDLDQIRPEGKRIFTKLDPTFKITPEEKQKAVDEVLKSDRYVLYKNSFVHNSIDQIVGKVRQMSSVYGCKYVVLDHISIIVSDQEEGDERKAIDEVMTKLRNVVEETGIHLFLISHLKRPQGKGHEEGAMTSLAELRGSAAIGQLSDNVLSLERNQQHEDEWFRHITTMRVLKCRITGLTGIGSYLTYDLLKGRIFEVPEQQYLTRLEEYQNRKNNKEQPDEDFRGYNNG